MAFALFWLSAGFLLYVYAGYPLILMLWRAVASRSVMKKAGEPLVTLVVTAHNEAKTIQAKLENCLELDYPQECLQIIVSLDGPTDGTEQVAMRYEARGIQVIHSSMHSGKAAAINRAVALARGEILVFADARQRLEKNCIRHIVANYSDPAVGAVSGELVIDSPEMPDGEIQPGEAVGIYWRFEKCIRAWESDVHSVVGATGALHSIRRRLFRPLPDDTILDDVAIPMTAVLGGLRVVFEAGAKAYDRPVGSPQEEFGRKVRTLVGNYQLIAHMPSLLLPWRNQIFLQFASHKLARLAAPYFLALLYLTSFFLDGWFYRAAFILQTCLYLFALIGYRMYSTDAREARRKPMYSKQQVEGSK